MTDSEKFRSDIDRIKKYERAQNGGRYNAAHVCEKTAELFENGQRGLGELPRTVAGYWMDTYITPSSQPDEEPTAEHIEKLTALYSFLSGDTAGTDALSADDWEHIGELVGYEAEDLPIDVLTSLMTVIVDKKALK